MEKWHTIIIGAGPGGLACAETLAEQGIEVLVLERKNRIGHKVCGGGVTGSGLLRDLPKDLIERSFATQHIYTERQNVQVSADCPIVSTVNREKLGQWMLQRANLAGATIRAGSHVKRIEGNKIFLNSGECISFRFLVGADGSSSIVRRHLGISTERIGTGIQYRLPVAMENMEWHLNASFFGNGYAWIFPHQRETSVGAYCPWGKIRPKELQKRFLNWAEKKGINLKNAKPEAGLINYDFQGWRFDNIFLIGDAAGLASGLTGEGIYPAVLSGKTVANTIITDQYRTNALQRLITVHRRHSRMVAITAKNNIFCRMVMEILVLGLRTRLINFSALEMNAGAMEK